jgi:endonuclease/exonuclease/phosphatase family metal-dependent hydrolase
MQGNEPVKQLISATWNLLEGGLDGGSDARLRRQMAVLEAAQPDVVALQEMTGWDRDGETLVHRAESLLGGMRGSAHGCHLGVFVREAAGLRVIRKRHEERLPYWHAVACVETEVEGFGRLLLASAHLAPSSPAWRQGEAEAFKLIAQCGSLIAGGDWNAVPAGDPQPNPRGKDAEHIRRKLDRAPARALEASGLTDIGWRMDSRTPTVGYTTADQLAYRCDRIYTTLPAEMVIGYQVITDADAESDHRPVVGRFSLNRAAMSAA